ncbi:Glutamate 5-kinase/delta-1-pyrroline-5-carboxylate synthase [Trinorchestia longiramus]|nr:Glutamate 5-kinase/delta-1-pyrroline-5-carboxylate synthase [Trinorchestia longiramus]
MSVSKFLSGHLARRLLPKKRSSMPTTEITQRGSNSSLTLHGVPSKISGPGQMGLAQQMKTTTSGPLITRAALHTTRNDQNAKNKNVGGSFPVFSVHSDAQHAYQSYNSSNRSRSAYKHRDQLKYTRRIVVKLGSAVITRADGCGLALGRLASIVEQVAELQNEGKDMMIVTSGAVAFGKQKMQQELLMSLSMRETLSHKDPLKGEEVKSLLASRASAAVGQSGLMSLYEAMFAQYGVKVAQILITKPDFYSDETRKNLISTINELLALNILPIINTNDAVSPPPELELEASRNLDIKDNDSLASRLASEIESDLIILMTNVDGIFTKPPSEYGARLIDTFSPAMLNELEFGEKSSVGTGGMDSKVKAANYALARGTNVVICNGLTSGAIKGIVSGRKIGTFFTTECENQVEVEALAKNAEKGSRTLQTLSPSERSSVINKLADLLVSRQSDILEANRLDLEEAHNSQLSAAMTSRLSLSPSKLKNLSDGLKQIAIDSRSTLGRVMQRTKIAENVILKKITVPIGVLLVIFESRPDCLPQVAALAMATGNGLLLKGGKEASHSNKALMGLVSEALSIVGAQGAISLINTRDQISDLLQLDQEIDLVIPRGSSELVKTIQEQSQNIPVLGHAEGICHVYVDKAADIEKAVKIVKDSKCDYPAACNAMETLLLHRDIYSNVHHFDAICQELKKEGVQIYAGPKLSKHLTFGPPLAKSFKVEYGDLECTVEIVENMEEAIDHIHTFGSSHTDVIITEDKVSAKTFLDAVDSACVFHNASSRFADGFRFGLGAEVGISTARIHARGPVGMEGLLTSKWIIEADAAIASEFTSGLKTYIHEALPLDESFDQKIVHLEYGNDAQQANSDDEGTAFSR